MEDAVRFAIVEKLLRLSRADWKYADLYIRSAEASMVSLCTREQFRGLRSEREHIAKLLSELRRAIRQADWSRVEQLAAEGSDLQRRLDGNKRLFALAEEVYGKRSLEASSIALALSGVVAQPARLLEREIARLGKDLRALAEEDGAERGFYERRAAFFDRVIVDLPKDPPPRILPSEMKDAALAAVDGTDFNSVLRIARNLSASGQDRSGRIRAPRPVSGWVERLAEPIPSDAVESAGRVGLALAELDPDDGLNDYLSCSCADDAVLPSVPLSAERREIEACTCGHACPPEAGKSLQSSLDALMVHPFLTSGGTRYLPWFGSEQLLVETFDEDEPDARTPLLEALQIPRRRGLTRYAIEDALLSEGPRVCEGLLGLDPVCFRIVCIPFDVYKRLGGRFGWGSRRLWTHFDGYQVTRELRLQALVGGDVQFGGVDDLCGVGRGYDSEHVTARFAVVRRDRFDAREPRVER